MALEVRNRSAVPSVMHPDDMVRVRRHQPSLVRAEVGADQVGAGQRDNSTTCFDVDDRGNVGWAKIVFNKAMSSQRRGKDSLAIPRESGLPDPIDIQCQRFHHRVTGARIPHAQFAPFGAGDDPPPVLTEAEGGDFVLVREHLQQPRGLIQRLLDADAVDGFLGGFVGDERQRIGKPEQRARWIAFVEQAHAVGDVEADDALAVFFAELRVLSASWLFGGERASAQRAGVCLPADVARPQASNDREHAPRWLPAPSCATKRSRRSSGAHPAHRFAALEQRQVGVQFGGGLVAVLEIGVAGAER